MSLNAQDAETHGADYETLHDVLHGFHLVDGNGCTPLVVQQVAQEDGVGLAVHGGGELLEFLVTAQARGNLQRGNRLGIPGVWDTALAVMEQAHVGQERRVLRIGIRLRMDFFIVIYPFFFPLN